MLQKKVRINKRHFLVKATFLLLAASVTALLASSSVLAVIPGSPGANNPSTPTPTTTASPSTGSTTPAAGCYVESVGSTGSSSSSTPSSFNSSRSNSATLSSISNGRGATIILASKRTVAVIPGSPDDSTSTSGSGAPSTTTPSSGSSSSDSGATVTFSPTTCSGTYDTGGYKINTDPKTGYCYVTQNNTGNFTQEPCTTLVCQEGSQAIANDNDPNLDCTPGDSDYCGSSLPPADQSEQCSSDCDSTNSSSSTANNNSGDQTVSGGQTALCNSIVTQYIDPIIQFLGVGVGIVIVIMVVIGGIQYATAGDNPQAMQDARGRIINAIIALVVFGLMYAFLNWLLPGGLF